MKSVGATIKGLPSSNFCWRPSFHKTETPWAQDQGDNSLVQAFEGRPLRHLPPGSVFVSYHIVLEVQQLPVSYDDPQEISPTRGEAQV